MGVICRDLKKTFGAGEGKVEAIADVSFEAADGEFVCFVGPSGCGKTTLLRIAAGLASPTSGEVRIAAPEGPPRPLSAMIFQEHGLFPWMSVLDNVAFGLESRPIGRAEKRRLASRMLEQVGIAAFADSYPHVLSVGMRQRAGIARALVADPHVLLLDEPFAALDAQTRWLLQGDLLDVWSASRKTVLFVTHDIDEAIRLADRIFVLTARPARVREVLPLTIPRPREAFSGDPEAARTRSRVWSLLRDDARRSLEAG